MSNQFWKGNEEYITNLDVINSRTFYVQLCQLYLFYFQVIGDRKKTDDVDDE